jgi:hypothetical protein
MASTAVTQQGPALLDAPDDLSADDDPTAEQEIDGDDEGDEEGVDADAAAEAAAADEEAATGDADDGEPLPTAAPEFILNIPNAPSAKGFEDALIDRAGFTDGDARARVKIGLMEISAAKSVGDFATVAQLANGFRGFTRRGDILNRDVLKVHTASLDALFRLGRIDDAQAKLQWIQSVYGAEPSLTPIVTKLRQFQKDFDGALDTINEGLCSLPAKSRKYSADSFILLKAELLIARGQTLEARALLLEHLPKLHTFQVFKLLRMTITRREEIHIYEDMVLPRLSQFGSNVRHALYHYAYLLRRFEDFDGAIAVARDRFLATVKKHGFGSMPKKKGRNWIKEAEIALADLQDDFHRAGLEFFLISGTLLGCVRENGIIGHDKDIDVGVTEDVTVESVQAALQKSKRFFVRPIDSVHSVYIEHANGVKIDVFRHFMEDGRYVHEGPKVAWWNTPFNLVRTDFLGRTYYIPDEVDLYLTENYGEWRIPDSEFETFVDTPNMLVRNREYLIWYYFCALGDYFVWGKIGQFRRVWEALGKLYPVDALLTIEVAQIIASPQSYVAKKKTGKPAKAPSLGLTGLTDGERAQADSAMRSISRFLLRRGPATPEDALLEARRLNELLKKSPGDARLQAQLEHAGTMAARAFQAKEMHADACRVWYSLRGVPAAKEKADRNLVTSGLKGARAAELVGDMSGALRFWRYVKVGDPASEAAEKGIARCQ